MKKNLKRKVNEIGLDYETSNELVENWRIKITPDLTEMSIVADFSWIGRVEGGFRMIEEGTSDGDKADITPPSFEVERILSFTDLNFPFL